MMLGVLLGFKGDHGAKTCITRMVDTYAVLFGEQPKEYHAPLEEKDHPKLDTSDLCAEDDVVKYQSLLGAMQWCISLCRMDIALAVMTLRRFRVAGLMDHSEHSVPTHDWMYSVYGDVTEELPHNMPTPKGKPVQTTTYVDANLYHDYSTGRSVTGVLHFLNQTPIEWFSKHQNTVETVTYGSEFTAARSATEQIIDLRYALRMFGAPILDSAWMFGDNQSVITSSTIPHSTLSKRHNALSYHRVREAIAAGILHFHQDRWEADLRRLTYQASLLV